MRAKLETWMAEQGDKRQVFNEPLLAGQEATPIGQPAKAKKKASAK